eukprot:gnl/TRDRNA2_/TRDRNA2_63120_c0_seq1.p1 gnl/TRDRNA2_/TRDRNA2_63120_c0~~gnl/TRDRNA2_/TRDRNA2_63120_c0_seq1.p1  ORF type:complete len:222 (+),score=35.08 gnl/TRDRNA2_/TRDRNA2_63120_c0_seq1:84-749(+)
MGGSSSSSADRDAIDKLKQRGLPLGRWQKKGEEFKDIGRDVWVQLLGTGLVSAVTARSGRTMGTDIALSRKKAVALYFPQHRIGSEGKDPDAFRPKLVEWYTDLEVMVEVVAVCSERLTKTAFNLQLDAMPWLAIPFAQHRRREGLMTRFKINYSESSNLVILGRDGMELTTSGDDGCKVVEAYIRAKNDDGKKKSMIDSLEHLSMFEGEMPKLAHFMHRG